MTEGNEAMSMGLVEKIHKAQRDLQLVKQHVITGKDKTLDNRLACIENDLAVLAGAVETLLEAKEKQLWPA